MATEIPNIFAMTLESLERLERKLDAALASVSTNQSGPSPDEFKTVAKTAEFLNCSEPHVYTLKAKIPHVLRGARLYFKTSDLLNYLEQGRVVPDKRMARNRTR